MPCLGSSQHQHDGPPASAEVADDDHGVPLASAETIELGAPHLTSGNGLCPEPPLGTLEGEVQVRRQERAQHPHVAMTPLDLKIGAHHPPRDRTHLLIGQSAPQPPGHPLAPIAMASILACAEPAGWPCVRTQREHSSGRRVTFTKSTVKLETAC